MPLSRLGVSSILLPTPVHGVATAYGGDGITTEGRVSMEANPDLIQLTFAGSISDTLISNLTVTLVDPLGDADGTWIPDDSSVSGDVLTLAVYGMTNRDSLMLTVNGVVNNATSDTGTYEVYMGVLAGDADGNGQVNGIDEDIFASNINQADNGSNFMADFNCSGAINGIDFDILASDYNVGLSEIP